jgi:hypothetical protein
MSQAPTNPTEFVSPLARLFQIARQKGYLTYTDILAEMPQPDLSMEQLERLFGALIAAGIPFGDDDAFTEHTDQQ